MDIELTERNPAYDAMLAWSINFTEKCNLNCAYCFKNYKLTKRVITVARRGFPAIFKALRYVIQKNKIIYVPPKINTAALLKTLEKTNKIFKIGFTNGEPFLVPNIVDASVALTKKHYIYFITNLSLKKVEEFVIRVDPSRVLCIVASLHIKELERHNLLKTYLDNFQLCKKAGIKIDAVETAYPPIMPEVEKYRVFFKKYGIKLEFNPFVGEYKGKAYPDAYTASDLEIFGLSRQTCVDWFYRKGKLCNAGYNVAQIDQFGTVTQCHNSQKRIGHIYKEINFEKELIRCPFEFCECSLCGIDPYLFKKALDENKEI
jgi:MoaA/NifB/PqqE/SkfB family radical SAM enzyme